MDDLVQWLRAQLDEDERIARAVEQPDDYPWKAWHMAGEAADGTVRWGVRGAGVQPEFEDPLNKARMLHIAAHDPARVLREIDTKRQVLTGYVKVVEAVGELGARRERLKSSGQDVFMTEMEQASAIHKRDVLRGVLQILALPYADRPGYREDWRP